MSKENEYKEIFLAEAVEGHEELNRLITQLEKKPEDKKSVDAVFRITHTLKGNALGMGFQTIGEFAHVIEDVFGAVRDSRLELDAQIFSSLFKAVDILGELIDSLKTGKKVKFRGIKTKLEVLLKSTEGDQEDKTQNDESIENGPEDTHNSEPERTQTTEEPEDQNESKDESQLKPLQDSESINEQENVIEATDTTDDKKDTKIIFSDHVQVPVRKLDNLLNLVGELVIERDRIIAVNNDHVSTNEYSRLNRISSDLQYSVMDVRLVLVSFLFNKFHRIVRDIANLENKSVNLKLEGTETEIDRNILQIISDSLIHLIRNAIGHGIESIVERKNAGKHAEGTITLSAISESDAVIIKVKDDGFGIDAEKVRQKAIQKGLLSELDARQFTDNDIILMIFEPGFSTMDDVNSISGRGVGMDVVKKALDSIGGTIAVETEKGIGTTFSLRLPSSMAVKGTLLFELGQSTFAIPLSYTEAVVSLYKKDIHKVSNGLVTTYLGRSISLVFLQDVFELNANTRVNDSKVLHKTFDDLRPEKELNIIIVSYNERIMGLVVDKLLQQKEIVEKPLMKPFDNVKIVNGVTILGNGHVCLVMNVAILFNLIYSKTFTGQNRISQLHS